MRAQARQFHRVECIYSKNCLVFVECCEWWWCWRCCWWWWCSKTNVRTFSPTSCMCLWSCTMYHTDVQCIQRPTGLPETAQSHKHDSVYLCTITNTTRPTPQLRMDWNVHCVLWSSPSRAMVVGDRCWLCFRSMLLQRLKAHGSSCCCLYFLMLIYIYMHIQLRIKMSRP